MIVIFFFFNDTATTEIYTLSLHDALPICTRFSISDPETSTAAWAAGREKTNAPKRSATLTEVAFGVIGASTFGSIVAESQYEPGGISRNSKFPFVGFVTVNPEKLEKPPGWRGPSLTSVICGG